MAEATGDDEGFNPQVLTNCSDEPAVVDCVVE